MLVGASGVPGDGAADRDLQHGGGVFVVDDANPGHLVLGAAGAGAEKCSDDGGSEETEAEVPSHGRGR